MGNRQLSVQCDCTPVADIRYRPDGDLSPGAAVVTAISRAAGTPPLDLPPLHDSVDVDALEALLERGTDDAGTAGDLRCFTVEDWNVFVREDGRIRVCEPAPPAERSPVFD